MSNNMNMNFEMRQLSSIFDVYIANLEVAVNCIDTAMRRNNMHLLGLLVDNGVMIVSANQSFELAIAGLKHSLLRIGINSDFDTYMNSIDLPNLQKMADLSEDKDEIDMLVGMIDQYHIMKEQIEEIHKLMNYFKITHRSLNK